MLLSPTGKGCGFRHSVTLVIAAVTGIYTQVCVCVCLCVFVSNGTGYHRQNTYSKFFHYDAFLKNNMEHGKQILKCFSIALIKFH